MIMPKTPGVAPLLGTFWNEPLSRAGLCDGLGIAATDRVAFRFLRELEMSLELALNGAKGATFYALHNIVDAHFGRFL